MLDCEIVSRRRLSLKVSGRIARFFRCCDTLRYFRYSSVWPGNFCTAFRTMPDSTVTNLRIDVKNQLGYDNIPRDFVFLKCVGRCFTVVNTHLFWFVDYSSHSFFLFNCFVLIKFISSLVLKTRSSVVSQSCPQGTRKVSEICVIKHIIVIFVICKLCC